MIRLLVGNYQKNQRQLLSEALLKAQEHIEDKLCCKGFGYPECADCPNNCVCGDLLIASAFANSDKTTA